MRWDKPQPGDTRIIKKFLIFPKAINYEVRWLEIARIKQFYRYWSDNWIDEYWVDEE